jgi:hypothetical protein
MAAQSGNYDLTKKQIKFLCLDFLASKKQRPQSRFGCYLLVGSDKFSDLARYVETRVFDETFQNNHIVMLKEYGPYDVSSIFFVVIDHLKRMPIGAMRIILPSKVGLKTLVDLESSPLMIKPMQFYEAYKIKESQCVDLATIAVDKDYRGRTHSYLPSLLLYRSLYLWILQDQQYERVVAIIDQKPYRLLLKLGMPFKTIMGSDSFSYLNSSVSFAVQAKTSDFLPSVSARANRYLLSPRLTNQYMRRLMRRLINGRGLDDMINLLQTEGKN